MPNNFSSSLSIGFNSEPLYRQVKELVLEKISSGEWPVHHRLPSENRLVEELGISRMTVHRALKELTEDHVLRRVPGVGTFVSSGKGHLAMLQIEDIRDQIASRGNDHLCEVKVLKARPATNALAELFRVEPNEPLFHSKIVHWENDVPVMLEDKFVLPRLVPHYLEQDFTRTSTTRYLRSLVLATEAEQSVQAIQPTRMVRKLLRLDDGPCLKLSRRIWIHDTVAVQSERIYPGSFHLGSRFKNVSTRFS